MIGSPGAQRIAFIKAHGTGNDFVLLPDLDAQLELRPQQVRGICHRRYGMGADGILRVVPTALVPEFAEISGTAEYFMDHRNADGTLPQMCGNGARVFARYLRDAGLVDTDRFAIATRGGVREVDLEPDGSVTIDMGSATTPRARVIPIVEANGRSWQAVGVLVPNPHAVVFVDDLDEAGDLERPPTVVPEAVFPEGVNVEFVQVRGRDHVSMRVHERGVGQTLACGTGACAVAWATLRRGDGQALAEGRTEGVGHERIATARTVRVDMPGGTVKVTESASRLLLNGPVAFVADGTIRLENILDRG